MLIFSLHTLIGYTIIYKCSSFKRVWTIILKKYGHFKMPTCIFQGWKIWIKMHCKCHIMHTFTNFNGLKLIIKTWIRIVINFSKICFYTCIWKSDKKSVKLGSSCRYTCPDSVPVLAPTAWKINLQHIFILIHYNCLNIALQI